MPYYDFLEPDEDELMLWAASQKSRVAGLAGPFSPLALPNLRIWIEVNLSVTGLSNGDPITTANDLSGLGNDMGQSVAANKPAYITGVLNGLPIARFTHLNAADGHWMTSPYSPSDESAPNVTFAAVWRTNNAADSEMILWAGDPAGNGFGTEAEISLATGDAGGGNLVSASYGGALQGPESTFSPFNDTTNFHVAIGTFDNLTNDGATKNANLTMDNVAQATGSGVTDNNYGVYEGQTWWGKPDASGTITRVFNGDMAALVVCAAVLTAGQQTQLYNFWKAKYNL